MKYVNVCTLLALMFFSLSTLAADEGVAEKSAIGEKFLTVDALHASGYKMLSGEQILALMKNRSITVIDIETDAVTTSGNKQAKAILDRAFVETKSDKVLSQFDPRLMARAPMLEGKIKRKVVADELIASDAVRTYHYRLYRKHETIFAVRDIDHGNVFFEVKVE